MGCFNYGGTNAARNTVGWPSLCGLSTEDGGSWDDCLGEGTIDDGVSNCALLGYPLVGFESPPDNSRSWAMCIPEGDISAYNDTANYNSCGTATSDGDFLGAARVENTRSTVAVYRIIGKSWTPEASYLGCYDKCDTAGVGGETDGRTPSAQCPTSGASSANPFTSPTRNGGVVPADDRATWHCRALCEWEGKEVFGLECPGQVSQKIYCNCADKSDMVSNRLYASNTLCVDDTPRSSVGCPGVPSGKYQDSAGNPWGAGYAGAVYSVAPGTYVHIAVCFFHVYSVH